jgi:hypothetical protein
MLWNSILLRQQVSGIESRIQVAMTVTLHERVLSAKGSIVLGAEFCPHEPRNKDLLGLKYQYHSRILIEATTLLCRSA